MFDELSKWLFGVLTSAATLGFSAFIMRSTITNFITKSVEHRFDKKIERFKSEIRGNEKEFEQIRAFMGSTRRERDSALQLKRFEAAEILIRYRNILSQLSMLVEYMKIIKIEEVIKNKNDPKIHQAIKMLIEPFNINEKFKMYGDFDRTIPDLYLSNHVRKLLEAYQALIFDAAVTLKILSTPIEHIKEIKPAITNKDELKNKIIDIIPSTKESFDKYGHGYAYYWKDYLYEEILKELRNELSGNTNMIKDTDAATQLALDSRQAQIRVRTLFKDNGLSDSLINSIDT